MDHGDKKKLSKKQKAKAKKAGYKGGKKYKNSIKNPANAEYVSEVAFNEGVSKDKVTQEQFNKRYLSKKK